MPKRDTKLFEVLIGQIAKDGGVDIVRGKALRVLGHAERFEPVHNGLHRGPPTELSCQTVRMDQGDEKLCDRFLD